MLTDSTVQFSCQCASYALAGVYTCFNFWSSILASTSGLRLLLQLLVWHFVFKAKSWQPSIMAYHRYSYSPPCARSIHECCDARVGLLNLSSSRVIIWVNLQYRIRCMSGLSPVLHTFTLILLLPILYKRVAMCLCSCLVPVASVFSMSPSGDRSTVKSRFLESTPSHQAFGNLKFGGTKVSKI